eukprot:6899396-Pyramimonas_sp.AAC.1
MEAFARLSISVWVTVGSNATPSSATTMENRIGVAVPVVTDVEVAESVVLLTVVVVSDVETVVR